MADKCVTAVFFLASVFLFATHVDASESARGLKTSNEVVSELAVTTELINYRY